MHQTIFVYTLKFPTIGIFHDSISVDLILLKKTCVFSIIFPDENSLTILLIIDKFSFITRRVREDFFTDPVSFFIFPFTIINNPIVIIICSHSFNMVIIPITFVNIPLNICESSSPQSNYDITL